MLYVCSPVSRWTGDRCHMHLRSNSTLDGGRRGEPFICDERNGNLVLLRTADLDVHDIEVRR